MVAERAQPGPPWTRSATGPRSITYYLVVSDNTCFGNVNIPGCVVHIIVAPSCTQQKHMSVGLEGGVGSTTVGPGYTSPVN